MAEEAKDEATTIPAAISRVRIAVFAIYFTLPAVALSALPVDARRATGEYQTLLGLARGRGRLRRRPDPRRRQGDRPRRAAGRRRDLRRPARGDDPLHRDERRAHRRLAARLLDGHPPPGARPAAPAAPALRHAVDRDPRLRRRRLRHADPRPGRLPRQHVRVRRDAVVHDRAPRRSSGCAAIEPDVRAPVPRSRQRARSRGHELPLFAVIGGLGTAISFVVVTVLNLDVGDRRRHLAGARHRPCYVVYRRRQGLDLVTTVKVVIPRARHRDRGRVRVGARRARRAPLLAADDRDGREARRRARGAGSTCS